MASTPDREGKVTCPSASMSRTSPTPPRRERRRPGAVHERGGRFRTSPVISRTTSADSASKPAPALRHEREYGAPAPHQVDTEGSPPRGDRTNRDQSYRRGHLKGHRHQHEEHTTAKRGEVNCPHVATPLLRPPGCHPAKGSSAFHCLAAFLHFRGLSPASDWLPVDLHQRGGPGLRQLHRSVVGPYFLRSPRGCTRRLVPVGGVEGIEWLWVALAFALDLSSYGGGARARGRRADRLLHSLAAHAPTLSTLALQKCPSGRSRSRRGSRAGVHNGARYRQALHAGRREDQDHRARRLARDAWRSRCPAKRSSSSSERRGRARPRNAGPRLSLGKVPAEVSAPSRARGGQDEAVRRGLQLVRGGASRAGITTVGDPDLDLTDLPEQGSPLAFTIGWALCRRLSSATTRASRWGAASRASTRRPSRPSSTACASRWPRSRMLTHPPRRRLRGDGFVGSVEGKSSMVARVVARWSSSDPVASCPASRSSSRAPPPATSAR